MFYIIFVFVTSIEGTPLFLGNEHLLWVAKPPEGGGVLNKCLWEEGPPDVQPLTLAFIYHFSRKRYQFRIPSIDKWYPFRF